MSQIKMSIASESFFRLLLGESAYTVPLDAKNAVQAKLEGLMAEKLDRMENMRDEVKKLRIELKGYETMLDQVANGDLDDLAVRLCQPDENHCTRP